MEFIVTITVSGDVPDTARFNNIVAEVLEHHARDLRDLNSAVGREACGFIEFKHDGEKFRIDWKAVFPVGRGKTARHILQAVRQLGRGCRPI